MGTRAFTLMEMLVVVAIIGVIVTVSLPPLYRTLQKTPMVQAMNDLEEACRRARMMAIMTGKTAELVIDAETGGLTVRPTAAVPTDDSDRRDAGSAPTPNSPSATDDPREARASVPARDQVPPFTAQIHEDVAFKTLLINRRDAMDEAEARVRFQPNGTCDEFIATLLSTRNEERTMSLEICTGRESWAVAR
ncbi:MAG: prepilin-type N-terminal cleavage/methylation domain-containing protein [Limisphaerales bacterium]